MNAEDYKLNEFGSRMLVKALNNCSDEVQEEFEEQLTKLIRPKIID